MPILKQINKLNIYTLLTGICLLLLSSIVEAREVLRIETADTEIEIRRFPANGDILLLGFPCDEGKSIAEEKTARSLAEDGIEVWMPDMLSAFMLPNVRSSIRHIQTDAIQALIKAASHTGKRVYLVASGADSELVLRGAQAWEASKQSPPLSGAILLFPRLFKSEPQPGMLPEYIDAVGKTHLPIMLLEGERTPNRWGLSNLSHSLANAGSVVTAKVIPDVRGFFFKRGDANRSEDVVTSQLAGLIKVSLFYLKDK